MHALTIFVISTYELCTLQDLASAGDRSMSNVHDLMINIYIYMCVCVFVCVNLIKESTKKKINVEINLTAYLCGLRAP